MSVAQIPEDTFMPARQLLFHHAAREKVIEGEALATLVVNT